MKDVKGFNLISVIIIVIITSVASAIAVGVITNNHNISNLEQLANDKNLVEFLEVYSDITSNYYEEINKEKLLDNAIDGMLKYLDDSYTTYLDNDERNSLETQLSGTYKGIGIAINGNTIVEVMDNTPAKKAGLKEKDVILKVNNTDVSEYASDAIAGLIKSTKKSSVNLTIKRGEETLSFNIELETLLNRDVTYDVLDNNIGYLKMNVFSKTLEQQTTKALNELENDGIKRLIIDLRGNTGGYLDVAEEVANIFLENGKVIYSLEDKDSKKSFSDDTMMKTEYPIVVLINNTTASAAEILTAALKDSYGAITVGETSYGKGKVQQTFSLSDGSMAKYTSAKWLRPSGECIDGIGIKPDYRVALKYEYDEDGNVLSVTDTQLAKAIEVISTMD